MAERTGFEPAVTLLPHLLSKQALSTTQAPLHIKLTPERREWDSNPRRHYCLNSFSRLINLFKIISCRDPEQSGRGGIRTHGDIAASTVFKTVPFDHSGTLPLYSGQVQLSRSTTPASLHSGVNNTILLKQKIYQ